jgi:plastocyanin
MTIRTTLGMVLGLLLAVGLAACSTTDAAENTGLQPSDRYIHVQATELDARRTLDQNPFPQETIDNWPEYFSEDDTRVAPGYYLFMSGDEEWRIGSYMFLPQEIMFIQGDRVTMDIFGVRGSEHHTILVGPDGFEPIEFNVRRGELHQIEFTVDQPGLYQLICLTHPPTMTTNIHVLPTGA